MSSKYSSASFQLSFLYPKYWATWLALICVCFLACLPWGIQWRLAAWLSPICWKLLSSRRQITLRNLELCFPEWSTELREEQAKRVFTEMLLGFFETLKAWFQPQFFAGRVQIQGLEHLQQAQYNQQGVLLLGLHSTLLDAGGYICRQYFSPDIVYRPQNNPIFEMMIYRLRSPIYQHQISHDDMRTLVKYLKQQHIIWYTPDQDFGLKQGVIADFFGVPSATVTAHRRLLKITNAVAIPIFFYRYGDIRNPQYQIILEPGLDNFPSDDEDADAIRTNQQIEKFLRIAPTQYMWFHRRFKTRPDGEQSLYD